MLASNRASEFECCTTLSKSPMHEKNRTLHLALDFGVVFGLWSGDHVAFLKTAFLTNVFTCVLYLVMFFHFSNIAENYLFGFIC